MLLDNDFNIVEKTEAEVYRPVKKPLSDYNSYIRDLPNITFREWIDNVPYCVFEEMVIHMIEISQEVNGHGGSYYPAIQFSDHILNYIITESDPWPHGSNPEISIDFVLSDIGLRDKTHTKDLIIKQHEHYNTYRKNSWSIFLDKHTITRFMYDFMKAVKDNIIFQKYTWRF